MARARAQTRRRTTRRKQPGFVDWIKGVPKLAAGIGAVVALVAGVLGIVTWAFPDAKPKSRTPTNAALEVSDLQKHVTFREYLRAHPIKDAHPTPELLAHDGVVALVRAVEVSGVKRADLYWTIRDSDSGADVDRQLAGHLNIRTTGDSGGGFYWVPAPSRPGRYFILFELDTLSGTTLNTARTLEFAVA